jgi:hypothetical protein
MNQNKNRRRRNNENKTKKKIIRCRTLKKPVFNNEICSSYNSKSDSNSQRNCENCKHSF